LDSILCATAVLQLFPGLDSFLLKTIKPIYASPKCKNNFEFRLEKELLKSYKKKVDSESLFKFSSKGG
jgi:hypothetical protein